MATSVFARRIKELMIDGEHTALQEALANRPDMGAIIQALELIVERWPDDK